MCSFRYFIRIMLLKSLFIYFGRINSSIKFLTILFLIIWKCLKYDFFISWFGTLFIIKRNFCYFFPSLIMLFWFTCFLFHKVIFVKVVLHQFIFPTWIPWSLKITCLNCFLLNCFRYFSCLSNFLLLLFLLLFPYQFSLIDHLSVYFHIWVLNFCWHLL